MTELQHDGWLTLGIRLDDLEQARRRIEEVFDTPALALSDEARRAYVLEFPGGSELQLERNWDMRWERYLEAGFREFGVILYAWNLADPLSLEQRLTEDPVLQARLISRNIDGEWFPPLEEPRDLDVENWSLFGLMEPVARMPEVAAELARRLDLPLEPVDSPQYGLYFATLDNQRRHCTVWTGVGPKWDLLQEGDYAEFPLRVSVLNYRDLERLDRVLQEDGIVDAELLERRIGPVEDDDGYEHPDDDETALDA